MFKGIYTLHISWKISDARKIYGLDTRDLTIVRKLSFVFTMLIVFVHMTNEKKHFMV